MTIAQTPSLATRAGSEFRLGERALDIFRWIEKAYVRHYTRRELMALSDDMLKDIGLSRGQAHEEASKPFWK
ncbi:MAG: DUF1127 domain-containing protein [Rhodobiaceae bacterium]|nr:DUF1127 domain-containing protein [Rhodobiaceae bacterium]